MNPWRAVPTLAVAALVAVGAFKAEGAWFAAALPLAAWLLLAGREPPEACLEAARTLSAAFPAAGQPVEVRVTVRNTGPRLDLVTLTERPPAGMAVLSGVPSWSGSLPVNGVVELRYTATFPRGEYRFESVDAVVEYPFGAMSAASVLPCPAVLSVPPRILPCPALEAGPDAVRPFSGSSGARRPGEGLEFHGTRDYSPGDRLRSLNWRAGALWGEAVVNVFEGERAIDAGVILDCRAQAYGDRALFESAAAASLSVAESLMDGGNRVAYLRYGSELHWTPSGAGRRHRVRIRAAAAGATLGDHAVFERFDHLPVAVFPPRSLVVLVSPLVRDDLARLRGMRALGYAVVVVRPNPERVGTNPERVETEAATDLPASALAMADRILELEWRLLSSRLVKAGIAVVDWDTRLPLSAARMRAGRAS